MHPCSHCHRHVLVVDGECPFCGAAQGSVGPAASDSSHIGLGVSSAVCSDAASGGHVVALLALVATLGVAACGDNTGGGSTSTTAVEASGASAYGGPEDSFEETGLPEETGPEETSESVGPTTSPETSTSSAEGSSSTDTGGDSTSSESGSGDSTGTDTGSATTDTGSAESADYGGAAPR